MYLCICVLVYFDIPAILATAEVEQGKAGHLTSGHASHVFPILYLSCHKSHITHEMLCHAIHHTIQHTILCVTVSLTCLHRTSHYSNNSSLTSSILSVYYECHVTIITHHTSHITVVIYPIIHSLCVTFCLRSSLCVNSQFPNPPYKLFAPAGSVSSQHAPKSAAIFPPPRGQYWIKN